MASTNLSNIDFNSSTWKDIFAGEFTDRLGFLTSGAMASVNDSVISPDDKGYTVTIPHWNTLSGDTDVITSSLTTTVNSLATYKDIGVWCEREKAFGADQLVKVVSGADPAAEIARQMAQYIANEVHKQAMNVLAGVFSVELATTHSTGSTFAGGTINTDGILTAKQKLGDNQDQLTIALLNSKVYQDALRDGIITNNVSGVSAEQFRSGMIGQMLGMNPVMTDKLTATSSVYPSYFAAPGAMIYKFRNRPVSIQSNANITRVNANGIIADIELYRNPTTGGGQDILIMRYSAVTHVPGVQYDGSGTATNPTNAQLATAANWTKVATDDKLIKIVELKTL